MNDIKFYKLLILINSLVPLALLAFDAAGGDLGANPVEYFLRTTGVLTFVFLLISLSVTPLRRHFGWNGLIKYRRLLGLFAFFYGALHLATYGVFDKNFDLPAIFLDVWQRPFIAFGMLAFFLMVPLAITSTNKMIKRLGGKNWAKLHKLVYVSVLAAIVHYWMLVKSDLRYPLFFALIAAALLSNRINSTKEKKAQSAAKPIAPQTGS